MSLINDMLRDLDTRKATEHEVSGLDRNVRALPPKIQRRLPPALLIIVSALIGGGVVWLLQRHQATPPLPAAIAPAAAPATVAPAPSPAPVPAALPVNMAPATGSPTPTVPAAASTPPATPAPHADAQTAAAVSPPRKAAATSHAPVGAKTPDARPASPVPAIPEKAPKPTPPARSMAARMETPSDASAARIIKEPALNGTPADKADVEYRRGLTAVQRGDTDEAGNAFRAALRLLPAHVGARQALLGLLTEQQRWSDVETLALDGVGLLPQRSDWALLAARLMYERGDPSAALDTLSRYAANANRNADYQILYALLLQRAGRNADAANCYRTALLIRPNEGRWWFGLGRALDADHRDADARDAYTKARDSGNLPPDLQQAVERRLR